MVQVHHRGVPRLRGRLADGTILEYHRIRGLPGGTFWKSASDAAFGSRVYLAAYQAARHGRRNERRFASIIEDYVASAEFRRLAPRTRRDYLEWIDHIRDKFGDAPLAAFERREIRDVALKWRDQ